ncbi:MAG: polyprenyl synthetase family protein, partial [Gemmatimonadota bacterium]|nr:polyprenyl synthetase family protein [Gemmatimonadota bacterium]
MTDPSPLPVDSPLDAYLAHHRQGVDRALLRAVDALAPALPEPWILAVRAGVLSGGKRLRPLVLMASSEAFGRTPSRPLYDLAASVELIHAYSLMHDDLPCMDDAELRRGRPTTHIAHGEDTTVRAGAALIPLAALQALRACAELGLDDDRAHRVVGSLLEAAGAGGMVGGQWLDLLGEGRPLGAAELDRLHNRKTGALLASSLVVGAIAAGAPRRIEEALGA